MVAVDKNNAFYTQDGLNRSVHLLILQIYLPIFTITSAVREYIVRKSARVGMFVKIWNV